MDNEEQAAAFASEASFFLDQHGCFAACKVRVQHQSHLKLEVISPLEGLQA